MFPVNVRLLLKVVIPHPNPRVSLSDSHAHWLWVNLLFARVIPVLCTPNAVPRLPWKEQLTSLARCVVCKSKVGL